MIELDIAGTIKEIAAIGTMLRTRWHQRGFHAVISINVPNIQFDLRGLPLSIEEMDRARRFRQVMDCNRSVMSWIVLRNVVGAMLDARPEDVNVVRTMAGKPSVRAGPGISIAHTGNLAIVAFSSEVDIGVDVEQVQQDATLSSAVIDTLSPPELAYLSRHQVAKAEFLVRAWTRKEAIGKVLGSGISIDLSKVSVAHQKGPRFHCRLPDQGIVNGIDLKVGVGYIAALASKTHVNDVIQFHLKNP